MLAVNIPVMALTMQVSEIKGSMQTFLGKNSLIPLETGRIAKQEKDNYCQAASNASAQSHSLDPPFPLCTFSSS